MPFNSQDPQLTEILVASVVVLITSVTSILHKIARGHTVSCIWVMTEFLTAIIAGFFMYEAYPAISQMHYWPDWLTLPIAVAVAAHSGGRVFQEVEDSVTKNWKLFRGK